MQWKNTETPTFAGSNNSSVEGPDVVETMQLLDRNGNVVATFTKQVDGTFVFAPQGSLQGTHNSGTVEITSDEYEDAGSFQPIWADLNLAAAAGTSEEGDSSYLAAMMGNVFGTALTKVHNMIGAVIGKLSVGGDRATTYPLAAVIGEIGEDSEHADAAVVAVIGGDGGAVNANAAFAIDHLNSNSGAGFDWVIDGHKEAHDGYNAGVPLKGFARVNVNSVGLPVGVFFGVATDDAGIVAQVGADNTIGDGSLYISHVDGDGKLFQKQNDVWVDLQA
jgi:hypothetical protein